MEKVIISFIIFFSGGILFTFTSCKEEISKKIQQMPGTYQEIDFSLDDIAEDLEFVTFSDEISLRWTRLVKWCDPYFYYLSQAKDNQKVIRFTRDGKFVDALDKQGRGPSEYISISDFFVDENSGNIYIITNKIVVFDKNLNYLHDIKYPAKRDGSVIVKWLNNQIHLFYFNHTGTGYDWVKMDTTGRVLESRKCSETLNKVYRPLSDIQVFYNENKLYRFHDQSDTIFQIDSTGYHPKLLLNRNFDDGYNIIKDEWNDMFRYGDMFIISDQPHRIVRSIYGIGAYWIINYAKHLPANRYREEETVLYNIKENIFALVHTFGANYGESDISGLPNDWCGSGVISPEGQFQINGDDYIYDLIDSYKFLNYINSEDFKEGKPKRPEIKQKMIDIADNLTIDDNPVLLLLELKHAESD
ncbi:MAG: 6-bladed beta-propeller [Bacteroidales bacterium]|nr:6-bladed beta-propeller [Bacteroidales bacterium]